MCSCGNSIAHRLAQDDFDDFLPVVDIGHAAVAGNRPDNCGAQKVKDGLYIVDRKNIYGAFVVRHGHVTSCAPILRNNIEYYKKVARWVPTEVTISPPQPEEFAQEEDSGRL
jgi:hypothetical protein